MKLIIAGSRHVNNLDIISNAMHSCFTPEKITEIVSGGGQGIDACGEFWAKNNNLFVKIFPANWQLYGKAAGPIRNKQMAEYADMLLALWDYKSPETKNMIDEMKKIGKPFQIIHLRTDNG